MHVYTLEPGVMNSAPAVTLYKLLVAMEPARRNKSFMLVGPYRYPDIGTNVIPNDVWENYKELIGVDITSGKHWKLEQRLYVVGEKWAGASAKIFTLTLHEPHFPVEFMLRVPGEVRKYMKLVRST